MPQYEINPEKIAEALVKEHGITMASDGEQVDRMIQEYLAKLDDGELGELICEERGVGDVYEFVAPIADYPSLDLTKGPLGRNASWRSFLEKMATYTIGVTLWKSLEQG